LPPRHAEENMQKLSSLLITAVISVSIITLTHESLAETSAAPSKMGTRLITLGTSAGPIPRAHRAQSSNLLTVNGVHYIVDAGDGVARRLAKARIDIRDLGTVFLTHHHDDHTAGLGWLMSAWDQNRTKPINVYGPPETEALVRAAVQYFNISAEIRIADGGVSVPISQVFVGHDVGTGVIYQDANIKVTAAGNTHFAFHKGPAAGKFKSYSYRFETPDSVIVFMGDSGPSDAVTELAKGADLLVTQTSSFEERMKMMIENGRWQAMTPAEQERIRQQATRNITLEQIGEMATRANVKTVVLSHLSARADGSDDYAPWASEVKKHFSGEVFVAKDLMEFQPVQKKKEN
jgi:ribonuclease BN (tRNA processing enzyme)